MKPFRLISSACTLLCAFITVSAQAATVPVGLSPGDTYQLVFLTSGTTVATSTDIADYNNFVQTQAALNPSLTGTDMGVTYAAIGSTSTVNATANAVVTAPVYLLDGTLVATGFSDFWDGAINVPINLDQFGNTLAPINMWTGTYNNGNTAVTYDGGPLGTNAPGYGASYSTTQWAYLGGAPAGAGRPMYALSSEFTVSAVPVPAAMWLFGSGLLGLVGVARRKAA
ncbi:MAG: VPLPA-CTERM sorting domain-containing protein [Gammaproteobacteria bacterium]|nr:VPLPA-CTERM sorting domain-containing protein [Gammaproteobacteria bacterium]